MYNPTLATRLLNDIRRGHTLKFLCDTPKFKYPDLLVVYDWLKNTDLTMKDGVTTFAAAMDSAIRDRALTWQDMAATTYENLELKRGRDAQVELTRARMHGALLMALSKETRMTLKDQAKSSAGPAGGGVTVVIRTFAEPADDGILASLSKVDIEDFPALPDADLSEPDDSELEDEE